MDLLSFVATLGHSDNAHRVGKTVAITDFDRCDGWYG